MTTSSLIRGPLLGQGAICEPILRALPAWFGIEEAIVHYVNEIDQLPTFLACQQDQVLGFVSLKVHKKFKYFICKRYRCYNTA